MRLLHRRYGAQRQSVAEAPSGPIGRGGAGSAGRALVPLHRIPETGGGRVGRRIQAQAQSETREAVGGGGAMSGDRLVVGRNVRKVDGVKLVTGGAVFTDDVTIPGMLYGKILPSPHAHARIRRIDRSEEH